MSNNAVGLKSRISKAANEGEIEQLLDEGDKYQQASEKTRRQWRRKANNRYNALVKIADAKKQRKGKETPVPTTA